MRALVFRAPGELAVEELPDPEPGPGEALLRVTATGICGSDLHGYTGESGRRHPGQVMGHETVGRVVALGPGVAPEPGLAPGTVATVNPVIGCRACPRCTAGDEHLCLQRRIIGVDPTFWSAFAELMCVPAANLVGLPETVPEEHGALVEPLAVGYHAAVRGGVGPADRVLVIGGGPIGQACALAARRLGPGQVVVSELSRSRRALVAALGFPVTGGADGTVGDTAGPGLAELVRERLGGPATVVLDAVGSSGSLAGALAASAPGARVVLVGMNAPQVTLEAYAVSTYERSILGSFCYSAGEFRETADWVATAPPGLARLIDGRVGLAGAPAAFAGLADGTLDASKVLVFTREGST
jgi:threonine dehydrogenase-like Zn-dependent dehydrogenase